MNMVELIHAQKDLDFQKVLSETDKVGVYQVQQKSDSTPLIARVLRDTRSHFALKREKDLLSYLGQFSQSIRLKEIRKDKFYYLQIFENYGETSLYQKVKKDGPLSLKKAKKFLKHAIKILEKAHSVGFCHGDIRPENFILGNERYFLTEWSNALPSIDSYEIEKLSDRDCLYQPPERMNGHYNDAGDIYALGCTLYFGLTGKHIYGLKSSQALSEQLWAHAHHSLMKPNRLPYFWRMLILWMTQKKPEKRPSLAELKRWLKDESVPKSIRKSQYESSHSFPDNALELLADEHFQYPLYLKARDAENQGDHDTAFNLYENGAYQEYSRAENQLGLLYEQGKPVRKSIHLAMNYFHQAFQKGNPYAAYNLARIFEVGMDVTKDAKKAFQLFQFAALRGHLGAQNKLGECYLEGKGVPQNPLMGHYWIGSAAHFGHEKAQSHVKKWLESA